MGCKFTTKTIVFFKNNDHAPTNERQALPLRAGLRIASPITSMEQTPSRADAFAMLVKWASVPEASGEPFAFVLRDRTSPSVKAVCRAQCAPRGTCKHAPHCSFVALAHDDTDRKCLFATRKHGHEPEAETEQVGKRYTRRQPISASDWVVGKIRGVGARELPCCHSGRVHRG